MQSATINLYHVGYKYYIEIINGNGVFHFETTKDNAMKIRWITFTPITRAFALTKGIMLQLPQQEPRQLTENDFDDYIMTETSFKKFVATKQTMQPAAFAKVDDPEGYEGLKAVLLYNGNVPIFEIAEGETWEWDDFKTINKRYAYFNPDELVIESDDLAEVELAMFKDYFDTYQKSAAR